MSLPEESVNNRPAGKKTSVVMAVLLFLAVISVAIFTYFQSIGVDIRKASFGQLVSGVNGSDAKASEVLYDIPFDSRERPSFAVYKDYILKCSRDGMKLLDKKGTEVWSESVPLNNPVARTNGRELLVADTGGQDIYVLRENGILWKDSLDVNLYNADISSQGYVTAVTGSKRYNSEVRVYNIDGKELFRSIIANDFAVTAKISSLGNMAVDSINTGGIKSVSSIRFFDMKGSDLGVTNLETADSILPFMYFTDNGGLFAVGDRSIHFFDKNRSSVWEKKFLHVSGASVTGGKRLAAVVGDEAGSRLTVFSSDGKELASCPVNGKITGVRSGYGLIAVSTPKEIFFYSEKCRNVGKYSSKSDISDVYFFSRQQAAVVSINQVTVVSTG